MESLLKYNMKGGKIRELIDTKYSRKPTSQPSGAIQVLRLEWYDNDKKLIMTMIFFHIFPRPAFEEHKNAVCWVHFNIEVSKEIIQPARWER